MSGKRNYFLIIMILLASDAGFISIELSKKSAIFNNNDE